MNSNHEFAILLRAGGREKSGIALAHLWSLEAQKKRALRGLGLTWGLAVFSVFLPLVHFFLVPAFLLGGPLVFYWLRQQTGRIIKLEADCPFCGKKLALVDSAIDWPLRTVCRACSEQVRVDLLP